LKVKNNKLLVSLLPALLQCTQENEYCMFICVMYIYVFWISLLSVSAYVCRIKT